MELFQSGGCLLRSVKETRGSVLTVSVLMTAILTLLAGGLAQLSLREAASVYRQENSMKAFFLAEAGVADAYSLLLEDYDNKDDPTLYPETSLGQGTYDVTILQTLGRVVIESVGKVKNVERTLLVEVSYDDGLAGFNYGILSNKEGELRGDSAIDADIHTNEDWDIRGNVSVSGAATAVGDVDLIGNATAESVLENAPVIEFPTFDFNYFYNLADPADRYTGDQDWNNVDLEPVNGVVYVDGDVRIRGSSELTGAIVATGAIEIEGNFTQTPVQNLPALMSRDDSIILRGNVTIQGGLIYSARNDVEIRGNVTTHGNIMSFDQVIGTGNLTLTASGLIPAGVNSTGMGLRKLTFHE